MANQRIHGIEPVVADDTVRKLFDRVQRRFGMVPNLTKVMALSPVTLQAFLALGDIQAEGLLSGQMQTQIAVAVAQANTCDYCLSAHTTIGRLSSVADDELDRNRHANSSDPRTQAGLSFAQQVVRSKGRIDDADLDIVRRSGYGDGEIIEILLNVAVNVLTNYINHVAGTSVDFPLVAAQPEIVEA